MSTAEREREMDMKMEMGNGKGERGWEKSVKRGSVKACNEAYCGLDFV